MFILSVHPYRCLSMHKYQGKFSCCSTITTLSPIQALSSEVKPVAFASGKSKLPKPCSFHILMLNTPYKNIFKAYSNCYPKGKLSKEE